MNVAYFDLETSALEGDVGRLLCGVVLSSKGEEFVFRNDRLRKRKNMADDGQIAREIRDCLERFDLIVGYYSKGFDIPFLNTRLVANGHAPIRPHLHLDVKWYMSGWRGLKPRNAKLATASEFFKLDERKMAVDVSVWIDAALGGDSKAMDVLVDRCKSDVRLLEGVTTRLLKSKLVKNISFYP